MIFIKDNHFQFFHDGRFETFSSGTFYIQFMFTNTHNVRVYTLNYAYKNQN